MEEQNIVYIDNNKEKTNSTTNQKLPNYNLENCILVRTTNIFPYNKIIVTPKNGHALDKIVPSIIEDAIEKKLENEKKFTYEQIEKEKEDFSIYVELLRSTIHFTINGLVSSHMQGNFENNNFIILEPLKYHIENSGICSLREEDTFFNQNMYLSDEAVIVISEETYKKIKNDINYMTTLEKFKLFIYKGNNQTEAVKQTLNYLGYTHFVTNNNGYVKGLTPNTPQNQMRNLLTKIREKFNIPGDRHCFSKEHEEDFNNYIKHVNQKELDYVTYILNNSTTISYNLKEEFFDVMKNRKYQKDYIINKIIEEISLDELKLLTLKYNKETLLSITNSNLKTK